ncbi:hypothetical protein WDJ50_11020 [Deinococcus sp. VB142]|uniref:Uncharacterized protein n=1 Tax=Deinococcus sp. VB142 TaxID=3112952 RepID=A0AAU6Q155_9DEIO
MEYTHTYTGMTPAQAHVNGQIDAQRVSEGYGPLVTIWRFEALPAEVQAAYWAGREGQPLPPSPAPALADGEYLFTLPAQGYRLAQRMTATVSGGRLTAWAYVNADGSTTPAADADALTVHGPQLLAVLAHEVSEAQRLAGLVHPVEFTPAPQPTPSAAPVGNASARALHVELSRLGYREHYAAASDALGRPVSSLAALTAAELKTVYSYAYGSLGLVG